MFTLKNLFIASTSIAINAEPPPAGSNAGTRSAEPIFELTSDLRKSLEEDIRSFDRASEALKGPHADDSAKDNAESNFEIAFDKVLALPTIHHLDLTLTADKKEHESLFLHNVNEAKETYDKAVKNYEEAVKNEKGDLNEVTAASSGLTPWLDELKQAVKLGNVEMKVEMESKPWYKQVWFIVIMILLAVLAIGAGLYFGLRK